MDSDPHFYGFMNATVGWCINKLIKHIQPKTCIYINESNLNILIDNKIKNIVKSDSNTY
jgi:hypothetical protein